MLILVEDTTGQNATSNELTNSVGNIFTERSRIGSEPLMYGGTVNRIVENGWHQFGRS